MGFLDWFSSKEEKKPDEAKVSLKDAEDFVEIKIKKDFETLAKPVKEEYANLQLVADTMQHQLKDLEQAAYPEKTYPAIIDRAVGNRKSFISKMNFLVNHVKRPAGNDMDSIIKFYDETNKLINITNLETTKEYAFLKILFEKEGKEVVHSFRQMVDINNKIGENLKELINLNLKLPKVKETVSEISSLTEELRKSEAEDLDKKIEETQEEIKQTEDELEKLHYSDDWKAFLEMQKAKEDLKLRMESKRFDFMNKISKLETPLKKYRWSFEKGILNLYIEKSFDSILREDPKGEALASAIKDMRIKIAEGKMDLKDSKKFMPIMEDIIENNTIGNIIEGYAKLAEELRSQEEKILSQEILKRKIKLESEIIRLRGEVEKISGEKKKTIERIKRMQANKEQKTKELESLLQDICGKRIRVSY